MNRWKRGMIIDRAVYITRDELLTLTHQEVLDRLGIDLAEFWQTVPQEDFLDSPWAEDRDAN